MPRPSTADAWLTLGVTWHAGVELAAEIAKDRPGKLVTLAHAGPALLCPTTPPAASRHCLEWLTKHGVKVRSCPHSNLDYCQATSTYVPSICGQHQPEVDAALAVENVSAPGFPGDKLSVLCMICPQVQSSVLCCMSSTAASAASLHLGCVLAISMGVINLSSGPALPCTPSYHLWHALLLVDSSIKIILMAPGTDSMLASNEHIDGDGSLPSGSVI